MIEVAWTRNRAGTIIGFTVTGHADYAAAGTDIVCAGVSAVTLTAVLGLRDVLGCDGTYATEDGRLTVRLKTAPDARACAILQTMQAGLREIARQYPQYVFISK